MRRSLPFALCVCTAASLWAQQADRSGDPDHIAAAAAAIRLWVADFDAGRLGSAGLLRRGSGLQPAYVAKARAAEVVGADDYERLTHYDVLQKLLFFAEAHPCSELADAVLGVAASGFAKSLVDQEARILRELGHWSLMRMDNQGVWFLLMRAAAGERLPFLADERSDEGVDIARQIAALRLLGMKGLPVFRSTLEAALVNGDPRVRLAAAEAFEFQRRPAALGVLGRALGSERHPVVSQALVRALLATLRQGGAGIDQDQARRAVRGSLRLLGQSGWRTDMELMNLVEQFPGREAIEPLITVLERGAKASDELVAAVNRQASPMLRERAGELLRAMTGAIVPLDQPAQWREFWTREQDRIVVPAKLQRPQDANATATQGFYGIPVKGNDIAFLIDTSGSMADPGSGTAGDGGRGRRSDRQPSRLECAKEQLLLAVQSMPPQSRYRLLTFAGDAAEWSKKPVPSTPAAVHSLIELLGHFHAEGGTNVYAALAQALELQQLRFGELGQQDLDEVFLLSDGEPTVGEIKDPEAILATVREANKYLKVRINTVYTGTGKGADFLRRLAQENDGLFVQR